mmetsp:Transcript_9496/g.12755  ORF Transcript_9496/g.12755 Transcript_9496/m.12755 type:complete len:459 (+) Transcript_9496:163-1539(+)
MSTQIDAYTPITSQNENSFPTTRIEIESFSDKIENDGVVEVLSKKPSPPRIKKSPTASRAASPSVGSGDGKVHKRRRIPKKLTFSGNNNSSGSNNRSPSPSLLRTKKSTKESSSRSDLLTREEEVELTSAIRTLKSVVRIRDDLGAELSIDGGATMGEPLEADWAEACSLSVAQLRRTLHFGQEARTRLVSANVGLIMNIARRHYYALKRSVHSGKGGIGTILTLQDMVQEGNLGLMEAAERFDPARGFRFSTYAAWWIRQRILQSIADYSRVIRLPVHVHSTLRTINRTRKEMEKEIGRPPSMPELAHKLEMPLEKLTFYADTSRNVLSLESSLNNDAVDDARTLGDRIASDAPTPEEDAEVDSLRQEIRAVIDGLGNKERDVLVSRFGLDDGSPKTVEQTAKRLGISRDRVRNVEARALNKLRHPQRNYRLKEYVGGDNDVNDSNRELSPESIWSF